MSEINTSDWLHAVVTFLGKEFSIAISTVRLVILRCKLLTSQCLDTVSASEAVTMPRRVLVCDTTLRYHLTTIITILQIIQILENLEYTKVHIKMQPFYGHNIDQPELSGTPS